MTERHQQFDWDEIERRVSGKPEQDDDLPLQVERTYTQAELAAVLGEFARWVVHGRQRSGSGKGANQALTRLRATVIGKRAITAAWLLNPGTFDGRSLAYVGSLPKVQASRRALCFHVADFESTFGIRSTALKSDKARSRMKDAAAKRQQRQLDARCPKEVELN